VSLHRLLRCWLTSWTAPIKVKKFNVEEADLPKTHFSREFMMDLMSFPDQIRNVALVGHLHHGKTSIMDMLVLETHDLEGKVAGAKGSQLRYTDTHVLERARGITIKSAPMSLVLQSSKSKSHLINIIDTPGHVNFVDEVACSIRLADGIVLVVDVVEGVMINTEQIIKYAVAENVPMTLVLNKVDRLILELKLPPKDAYFKLKHTVEEVNTVIDSCAPGRSESLRLSPEKGNVCFASAQMGWCFTLATFAKMYADTFPGVNTSEFAKRLWGDIFYNPASRKFTRRGMESGSSRSFVHFILEPLYKLYAHVRHLQTRCMATPLTGCRLLEKTRRSSSKRSEAWV
jgi:U5 small nuclear ribonucleoprotein component